MDRKGKLQANEECYNTAQRFEDYLRGWMKGIGDLLNESEQLRVETDDSGPQVFSYFDKLKKFCSESLQHQHCNSHKKQNINAE